MNSRLVFENLTRYLVRIPCYISSSRIAIRRSAADRIQVDTKFLLAIRAFSMPLLASLERTLHGKTKPFITKCSLAAITDLHNANKNSNSSNPSQRGRPNYLPPPTELPLRHCDHGDRGILDESECLLELVSGGAGATILGDSPSAQGKQPKNKEHYILATADAEAGQKIAPVQAGTKRKRGAGEIDIRGAVREVPGVPVIYVKRSVMILEEFSTASLGIRRKEEKEKMTEGIIPSKRKRAEEDEADDKEAAAPYETHRRGLKKVKGPNPLSVKKKKVRVQVNGAMRPKETIQPEATDQNPDKPKAKRRRKHSKKIPEGQGGTKSEAEIN